MDVIDVPRKIVSVPDGMLVIPSLPYATFAPPQTAVRTMLTRLDSS